MIFFGIIMLLAAFSMLKKKKNPLKERHFHFVVFRKQTHIALIRRKEGDIWAGLYTPWLVEGPLETPEWPKNKAFKDENLESLVKIIC